MEAILLIPVLAVMAGAALYFALGEPAQPRSRPRRRMRSPQAAMRVPTDEPGSHTVNAESSLDRTDVLLADTLNELIELKEEVSNLRTKVSELEALRATSIADATPAAPAKRPSRSRTRTRTAAAAHTSA